VIVGFWASGECWVIDEPRLFLITAGSVAEVTDIRALKAPYFA